MHVLFTLLGAVAERMQGRATPDEEDGGAVPPPVDVIPQHVTPPNADSEQVWSAPAATATCPEVAEAGTVSCP